MSTKITGECVKNMEEIRIFSDRSKKAAYFRIMRCTILNMTHPETGSIW